MIFAAHGVLTDATLQNLSNLLCVLNTSFGKYILTQSAIVSGARRMDEAGAATPATGHGLSTSMRDNEGTSPLRFIGAGKEGLPPAK